MLATIMNNMAVDKLPPECSANFYQSSKRIPSSDVCFIYKNTNKMGRWKKPVSKPTQLNSIQPS